MRIWRILSTFQDLQLQIPHQIRKFREKGQLYREEEEERCRGTAKQWVLTVLSSRSQVGVQAAASLDCLTPLYQNFSDSGKSVKIIRKLALLIWFNENLKHREITITINICNFTKSADQITGANVQIPWLWFHVEWPCISYLTSLVLPSSL